MSESPTLVRLRHKAESEETRLAGIDRQLDQVQRQLDSYERQAEAATRIQSREWLNPTAFALTLGGASLVMLGAALEGGAPVMGAGVAVSLVGVGCFWASVQSAHKNARVALDGALAQLQMVSVGIDQQRLQEERHRQEEAVRTAREAYESARQPLAMLQPDRASAVDERGQSFVVAGVVVPKRDVA